jgi:hypothetical protein
MTSLIDQVLVAGCGAGIGAGVFVLWRAFRPARTLLDTDLDALYAPRIKGGPVGALGVEAVSRWLVQAARRAGLEQVLLEDDLAVAGRDVPAHTTARLMPAVRHNPAVGR